MTPEIIQELLKNTSSSFKLGEYIYMGMGKVGNHRVCLSVAYKIDYCMKKAQQFEKADPNVVFTHINKVLVGSLSPCQRFELK